MNVEWSSFLTIIPCVTSSSTPFSPPASSLPRNRQALAISIGVGKVSARGRGSSASIARFSVILLRKNAAVSPSRLPCSLSMAAKTVRMRSLSIGPGKMLLTRMPRWPSSLASCREKALRAAFGMT